MSCPGLEHIVVNKSPVHRGVTDQIYAFLIVSGNMSWFKQSSLKKVESSSVVAATENVVDSFLVNLRCQNLKCPLCLHVLRTKFRLWRLRKCMSWRKKKGRRRRRECRREKNSLFTNFLLQLLPSSSFSNFSSFSLPVPFSSPPFPPLSRIFLLLLYIKYPPFFLLLHTSSSSFFSS